MAKRHEVFKIPFPLNFPPKSFTGIRRIAGVIPGPEAAHENLHPAIPQGLELLRGFQGSSQLLMPQ